MKRITYSEPLARSIQHWGSQDVRIYNVEMERWRKKWVDKTGTKYCADCTRLATLGDYCKECANTIPL